MDTGIAWGDIKRRQSAKKLRGIQLDTQFLSGLSQGRLNEIFTRVLSPTRKGDLSLMVTHLFSPSCQDEV
jgi:hypothetical protein